MRDFRCLMRALPVLAVLPLAACVETAVVGGAAAVGTTALQERGVKGAASDLGIRTEINDLLLTALAQTLTWSVPPLTPCTTMANSILDLPLAPT